jgi:hypothetical protein
VFDVRLKDTPALLVRQACGVNEEKRSVNEEWALLDKAEHRLNEKAHSLKGEEHP